MADFEKNTATYSLIIDGLFGIGYKYKKNLSLEKLFNAINASNAKIISIDTPSGLDPEGNTSIRADYTYSIGYLKEYFFNIGFCSLLTIIFSWYVFWQNPSKHKNNTI